MGAVVLTFRVRSCPHRLQLEVIWMSARSCDSRDKWSLANIRSAGSSEALDREVAFFLGYSERAAFIVCSSEGTASRRRTFASGAMRRTASRQSVNGDDVTRRLDDADVFTTRALWALSSFERDRLPFSELIEG